MLRYFLFLLIIFFTISKNELLASELETIVDADPIFEFYPFSEEVKRIINNVKANMNSNDLFEGDFEKYYLPLIQKGDLSLIFDWFAIRDKDGSNIEILGSLLRTGHVDINKYELIKWTVYRNNYILFKFLIDNGATIPTNLKTILNSYLNYCDTDEFKKEIPLLKLSSTDDMEKRKMEIVSVVKERITKMINLLD